MGWDKTNYSLTAHPSLGNRSGNYLGSVQIRLLSQGVTSITLGRQEMPNRPVKSAKSPLEGVPFSVGNMSQDVWDTKNLTKNHDEENQRIEILLFEVVET